MIVTQELQFQTGSATHVGMVREVNEDNHLIAAENLVYRATNRRTPWVEATVGDYNLDARQEVWLSNDKLAMLFAPVHGGQMYELDVRSICLNLLATLSRRPEAYHEKVRGGAKAASGRLVPTACSRTSRSSRPPSRW